MTILEKQAEICERFGAAFVEAAGHLKIGIALQTLDLLPLNGMRIPPSGTTCGWYVWGGEDLSRDANFFQPLHVAHVEIRCAAILPYLGLAPGWRFLIAPQYEDVWFDPELLGQLDEA